MIEITAELHLISHLCERSITWLKDQSILLNFLDENESALVQRFLLLDLRLRRLDATTRESYLPFLS